MYDIAFKGTKEHANADGLSRLPLEEDGQEISVMATEASIFNIAQIESLSVTATQIAKAIFKDSILSKVLIYTQHGWPKTVCCLSNAVNMNSLLRQVVCCGESEWLSLLSYK